MGPTAAADLDVSRPGWRQRYVVMGALKPDLDWGWAGMEVTYCVSPEWWRVWERRQAVRELDWASGEA